MQEASAVIKYFRTNNRCGEGASPVCAALGPTSSWLFVQYGSGSALLLVELICLSVCFLFALFSAAIV